MGCMAGTGAGEEDALFPRMAGTGAGEEDALLPRAVAVKPCAPRMGVGADELLPSARRLPGGIGGGTEGLPAAVLLMRSRSSPAA